MIFPTEYLNLYIELGVFSDCAEVFLGSCLDLTNTIKRGQKIVPIFHT